MTLLVNKEVDYMQIGTNEFIVFAAAQGAHDVGFIVPRRVVSGSATPRS